MPLPMPRDTSIKDDSGKGGRRQSKASE